MNKAMNNKRVWWCVLQERQIQVEAHDALQDVATRAALLGYQRLRQPYARTDIARNQIAHRFLLESSRPDDTLVMLDNDHEHPVNVLELLVQDNAPVVGALAFMRGQPYNACAFVLAADNLFHPIDDPEEDGLFPVAAIGHAAIAIQRRVFVALQKAGKLYPWWRYDYTEFDLLREDGTAKDGFLPSLPSEDMYFSRMCGEAGIPVYLDSAVRCPHLITNRVTGETFRQYRASLPAEQREELDSTPVEAAAGPTVDIIIPGWNNFDLTRRCLASLKQTRGVAYRVIYVDDGSEAGDYRQFVNDYPEVVFRRSNTNQGFIKSINLGMQEALGHDGDYLMWLNNDVEVPEGDPGWLTRLLAPFADGADVAATGPVTDNVSMFQKRDGPSAEAPPECWAVTPILIGFALALRKSVVREIGLLDERFGIGNFEDWDYSLRISEAGYRMVLCEDVWLHHALHQTFKKLTVDFTSLLQANLKKLVEKWTPEKMAALGVAISSPGSQPWSIRLITHANAGWLANIAPYLASLDRYSPFENWLLTVACSANGYGEQYPHLKLAEVPKVPGSPEVTDSLQHGGFLPYVPGSPDDVLIYTDGDIVLQRAPTDDERALLETLPPDAVACGWNSSPYETLALEASRLQPQVLDLGTVFDARLLAAPCFNIGVIAARRSTWEKIHAAYMQLYPLAEQVFARQQRQQWLVCFVVAKLGLRVLVLPYLFHTHGCYALPEGAELDAEGVARYRGEPILFRHHL